MLWQVRFDAPVAPSPLPLADGTVVALQQGPQTTMRRLSGDGGDTIWETTIDAPVAARIARTGQLVVVPLTAGRLATLKLEDGEPTDILWGQMMGELTDPVLARADHVYVRVMPGKQSEIKAFRHGSERPLWTIDDPTHGAPDTRFALTGGVLVVAGSDGTERVCMTGLDAATGETRWQHKQHRGSVRDLWSVAGMLDLLTLGAGVRGVDPLTGELRSARFTTLPYEDAVLAGSCMVVAARADGHRLLYCFDSIGEQIVGRLRQGIDRLIGAGTSEALVALENGRPALLSLPELAPIDFPEASSFGPVAAAAWARDVVYVVGTDQHTLTAVDLDFK